MTLPSSLIDCSVVGSGVERLLDDEEEELFSLSITVTVGASATDKKEESSGLHTVFVRINACPVKGPLGVKPDKI